MLRLKVINPNTSQAMSQQMAHSLQRQLADDVRLEVLTAEHGAPSIETAVEEAMAVVALLTAAAPTMLLPRWPATRKRSPCRCAPLARLW